MARLRLLRIGRYVIRWVLTPRVRFLVERYRVCDDDDWERTWWTVGVWLLWLRVMISKPPEGE